jgi:PleD family two-component response regulator
MPDDPEKRRLLLTGESVAGSPVAQLFHDGQVAGWTAEGAASFEQARFMLQYQPYDVLLIAGGDYPRNDGEGLIWLSQQREVPLLLLIGAAQAEPATLTHALENGASQWLPLDLALTHPALLAAALNRLAQVTDLRRKSQRLGMTLQESRRRIDRLVNLLWPSPPGDAHARWHSQRSMIERLDEEVSRAERYGDPLTVILGEVQPGPGDDAKGFDAWLTARVLRTKRRCDVVGQYGPHGFMVLLVHTSESGGAGCCRRLQNALGQPGMPAESLPANIRTFFGMASYSPMLRTPKRLLGMAEHHLETAKQLNDSIGAAV